MGTPTTVSLILGNLVYFPIIDLEPALPLAVKQLPNSSCKKAGFQSFMLIKGVSWVVLCMALQNYDHC